nr:MAG TPA: hypothetical protein [Caudoviricetes sp.]
MPRHCAAVAFHGSCNRNHTAAHLIEFPHLFGFLLGNSRTFLTHFLAFT